LLRKHGTDRLRMGGLRKRISDGGGGDKRLLKNEVRLPAMRGKRGEKKGTSARKERDERRRSTKGLLLHLVKRDLTSLKMMRGASPKLGVLGFVAARKKGPGRISRAGLKAFQSSRWGKKGLQSL